MRIVCENCGTKYSIADEKVRGKVFKIRCKKCGHIIVVRGTPANPAPAAGESFDDDKETRVFDYSGFAAGQQGPAEEPIWHVVINKEDVGPLTTSQVREKFASGEIDVDTFVWREGFADWVRLGAVEEFADLEGATVAAVDSPFKPAAEPAGAAEEPKASADPFAAAGAPDPFGGAGDLGGAGTSQEPASAGDLGGSSHAPAASAADPFAATAAEPAAPAPARGDLFGGAGAGRGSLFPEEEEEEPKPAMTGQRNENSVLFSLANLQALATGGPKKSPSVGLSSGPSLGSGSSSKEASGLLDIRAMAASTVGAQGRNEPEPVAVPNPFAGPVAAPMLMPVASERPKWLIPVLVMGGVLMVGIIAVLAVLVVMKGKTKPAASTKAPAVAENDTRGKAAANPPAGTAPARAGQPQARPGTGTQARPGDMAAAARPTEEAGQGGGSEGAGREGSRASSRRSRSRGHRSRATRSARASSFHVPSSRHGGGAGIPGLTSPRSRPRGGDSDVLASLLGTHRKKPRTASSRPTSAPRPSISKPRLTPSDVRSAMARVKGGVQRCYDKYRVPGLIRVRVTVSGSSGRVAGVQVKGKFSGTPTGRCVARAVRRAHFPKFAQAKQSFVYPFILR